MYYRTPERATAEAEVYFKEVGCLATDLACNLNKTAAEVVAAGDVASNKFFVMHPLQIFLAWAPIVVPGSVVPNQTLFAFEAGQFTQMPMMMGALYQDAYMFVYLAASSKVNDAEYLAALALIFKEDFVFVAEKYPPTPIFADFRPLIGKLGTSYTLVCPTRHVAKFASQYQKQPVFYYHFNHSLSFDGWGPNYTFCQGIVCHGAELPFVFVHFC